MRNIPAFTCEFGAATLILQEIPRKGEAYCVVQWVQPGQTARLLDACARFCRMAGARKVLASHLPEPPLGPPQVRLLRMTCPRAGLPGADGALWPLLPENGREFLRIYNEGMSRVPLALSLREADLPRLIAQGGGYFVHRHGNLLGIGQVGEDTLRFLVSCCPGAGREVAAALLSVLQADMIQLQVAESNRRAMALYEKLGFSVAGVDECWWTVWEELYPEP